MLIESLLDQLVAKLPNSIGHRVVYADALDPDDAETFKWILPSRYRENSHGLWRYTCSDRQLAILMIIVLFRKNLYAKNYPQSWKEFLKDW